jgi:hypothetical protein
MSSSRDDYRELTCFEEDLILKESILTARLKGAYTSRPDSCPLILKLSHDLSSQYLQGRETKRARN